MSKRVFIIVVGARPNFMKVRGLMALLKNHDTIKSVLVHTGQHYDAKMSDVFFEDLKLPKPDYYLKIGSASHAVMTAKIMLSFEELCLELKPELVITVGDVNSTMATALTAKKLQIKVAHIEAGLRSFDETMPEEINRKVTDAISDYLLISEPSAMENAKNEGIDSSRCLLVGDTMLETLSAFIPEFKDRHRCLDHGMEAGSYALCTLHRPSNVDTREALLEILDILKEIKYSILFSIHPRTEKRLSEFGLDDAFKKLTGLKIIGAEGYLDFLSLLSDAKLLLSDSGSIQSEASLLNIPGLILRDTTERPIYCEQGSTTLVARDKVLIRDSLNQIENGNYKQSQPVIQEMSEGVSNKILDFLS